MKKILIVEDDAFLKDLESRKLTSDGFKVSTAANAKETKEQLALSIPDLIILDIMLPEVDGFAILEDLRKNDATKLIPVLVFSNLTTSEDVNRAKKLGAVDFIIKSNFTLDEIAQKITSIIGK